MPHRRLLPLARRRHEQTDGGSGRSPQASGETHCPPRRRAAGGAGRPSRSRPAGARHTQTARLNDAGRPGHVGRAALAVEGGHRLSSHCGHRAHNADIVGPRRLSVKTLRVQFRSPPAPLPAGPGCIHVGSSARGREAKERQSANARAPGASRACHLHRAGLGDPCRPVRNWHRRGRGPRGDGASARSWERPLAWGSCIACKGRLRACPAEVASP